ncbi:extracellular tyrosine-protein kinase PKDCC [Anguilla rostrata]|uniref:extracellular tyrosine-protein kinase PKDCC n=1 Tax=Anguilla rostrata TaxID=7938 RepID=UPI0030D3AED0
MSSLPICAIALFALLFITLTFLKDNWNLHVHGRDLANEIPHLNSVSYNNSLDKELQERRKELLIYYAVSGNKSGALSKKNVLSSRNEWVAQIKESIMYVATITDEIGCDQLRYIKIVDFLGAGYTKAVVKGVLPKGFPVALKSVNEKGTDIRRCLEDFKDLEGCRELVSYKLIKEIVLLQRLRHPNLIKLQGHCLWSLRAGAVTAAFEQGSPLQMIELLQSPWEERFRVCLGLVRLLHYLSQSPLGSVALLDFQPRQFVLVAGELKLTDLDDASIEEPMCQTRADCLLHFPIRNFSIPCSPEGVCQGLNEKRNLYNAYRYFFMYLLPHQAPPTLRPLIDQIMNLTGELKNNVSKTRKAFEEILHLYKSGLYLQNLPPSSVEDYTALRGVRASGGGVYRCWPSYSQKACVLSVFSVREAAFICTSHPHCSSFTLGAQVTWTGRRLVYFRTGFSDLVPDVDSIVYIKKAQSLRTEAD